MRIETSCPAKINLFLAVGPRDANGYHPLRTVFQAVDLCDTLIVDDRAEETRILCEMPDFPEENTLAKALRLLREYVNIPPLEIRLEKRIPVQSGLGGGSSDAAGLLRIISRFLKAPLHARDLFEVAGAIGADVPFFLVGGKARGEGYGEKLTELPDDPMRWLVVARPDCGCPTPEAYRSLDRQEYLWREWPDREELHNDFERVAPDPCKDLLARLVRLGTIGSALCGSGSAVFGLFRDERVARDAAARLLSENVPHAWVVRTLGRAESIAFRTC